VCALLAAISTRPDGGARRERARGQQFWNWMRDLRHLNGTA
jgi:hypothetical protein